MKRLLPACILASALVCAAWILRPIRPAYQFRMESGTPTIFDTVNGNLKVYLGGRGWVILTNQPVYQAIVTASNPQPPWLDYQKPLRKP